MKEVFKDYHFNFTLQIIATLACIAFFIHSVKSCEIERINKCKSIKETTFNPRNNIYDN